MRDVRLLKIGQRELWLAKDRRYFGRQWRDQLDGSSRLDEAAIPFSCYDDAIEWVNAPPTPQRVLSGKKVRSYLPVWRGTRVSESR